MVLDKEQIDILRQIPTKSLLAIVDDCFDSSDGISYTMFALAMHAQFRKEGTTPKSVGDACLAILSERMANV